MRITPSSLHFVFLGETEQLSAVGVDGQGGAVSEQIDRWSSSDEAVVEVTAEGRVTSVGNGVATVRATIGGVTGGADVRVDQDVAAITVSPEGAHLTSLGETLQLTADAEDPGGSDVADATIGWTTSDPAVVTVDTAGLVQAVSNGVARVRASLPDGTVMGSADLVVDQAPVDLAFAVEPSVALSEASFDPVVQVTVLDALGNPVLDESPSVTVILAVNPSGAQLLGTVERNSVEGVSRFPDLAVDRAGSGYRLTASAEGLPPDTSAAFRIDPGPFAYVADNEDGTVSVVKVATRERVAVVNVGVRPYGLAASPDGSRVYVSNGLSNSVSVIETSSNTVVATVPVGEGPREVAMTPDGLGLVVHGNIHQDSVWYVDTADQTVTMKAEVARGNEGIAVSPDGSFALVTASADDVLSMLDVGAGVTLMNIPVGDYPRRVAMSPDGSRGFVTLYGPEQLAVVELPGGEVLERVALSNNPVDVAVAPDGSRVFVTHFPFSTTVSVLDAETRELVATIPLSGSGHSVTMGPHGRFAFVSHDPSSVSIIEISTLEVVSTFEVGGNPLEMAVIVTSESR